jgi:hypothetical protein
MSRFILPYQRVEDNNGHPLDGAQLFFFEEGTSTPKDTYSDEDFVTPNANPVIADSQGQFGDIFLDGVYRVELQDKNDVTQPDYPADDIGSDVNVLEDKELVADTVLFIDETDTTKKLEFDLTGITTDTTITLIVPDHSGAIDVFPSGTAIPFFQAAAPTGWTQDTDNDDKALRVVDGTGGGTGGTDPLSTPPSTAHAHGTSGHTLTTGQIPAHTHTQKTGISGSGGQYVVVAAGVLSNTANAGQTASAGSGGSHTHGDTDSDGPTAFTPQFIDVIVCVKD